MRKTIIGAVLTVFTACLLQFSGCAGGTEAGNPTIAGGTETGNPTSAKVRGRVVDSTGTPVESALVRLLPVSYNPVTNTIAPDSMTDITDSAGEYEIRVIAANYYRLTGNHPAEGTQIHRASVPVPDSHDVQAGTDTLALPGAISAVLSPANITASGYLYVPGTMIYSRVTGAGTTLLDSVPAGLVSVAYYDAVTGQSRFPGSGYMGITVPSGDTVRIQDDAPADSGVVISGNSLTISYPSFVFVPINFMGIPFITLLGITGPDTLAMVLYKMVTPGGTVNFLDTLFYLAGSMDSMRYAFYSVDDSLSPTGYISGSVLFSAFDTSSVIAGSFTAGSTLMGINRADTSKFPCSISGTFSATRAP